MKKLTLLMASFMVAALPATASAEFGIAAKFGTLGFGAEANIRVGDYFSFSAGGNYFTYGFDMTADDVKYDADLGLKSGALLANLHPTAGGFRITAGLLFNGNNVNITAEPTGTVSIGDTEYTAAQLGKIEGTVDFNNVAPYLGLGLGYIPDSRWGLIADFGVVFQGTPKVDISASGPVTVIPGFNEDLEEEEAEIQNELDSFRYYPVVALGIYVRF